MLSASFDFRRAIAQNTKTLVKGTLTLADGAVRELTGDDLMMGSTSFTDSVSSAGSFDIGAAIIGRLSLSLNNYDGRFDSYDFEGAEIVPYVGVRLAGGIEWIRKGVYGIEQPETYGNVIGMGALDNMRKLERAYAGVATTYPATLGTIAQDICTHCGVTLATSDFANRSFVVQERPDDTSLTCIAMLAYVAQASGNWARCDVWGRVRLDWYDTSAFEGEAWLDGDRFDGASPYASGDTANGGDFSNYGADATVDGGGFSLRPWAHVFALASLSVATDDVVVTGVRATAQDGEDDQTGESYLFGSEGYVLELPDNPLVQYGTAQAVASQVGARVVGMRFRPFDISALGDPTVEAGDPIIITDGKQRQYRSYLTTLTYKVGSYEAMACHAESPGRNRADSYTALTRALVKLRNADRDERSARELAVENLARQLAESSGLYMTSVPQQDGSSIYYMHDKPTLAQSQIVWKLTANAFGISTDGGRTYPYGLDVNGDAILNRIYAIGLNADYINAGSLTIRDGNTTVLSANAETGVVVLQDVSGNMWNMHTGQYRLAATSTIGGRTVSDVLDAVDATVTGVDVEYAQNQSASTAPSSGWSTTAPAWASGYYIWQRTATTTGTDASAVTTYSTPVMISGRDGTDGQTGPAGADGTGITSIVEQYYLSTSNQTQTGGSWSSTQPTWTSGTYIWTRSEITWDTTPATTTHTTPVLATALTQANSEAKAASNAVTALDNSLDQAEVFNRLTDNGTIQGLYMQNGQLYMNASYIKTGYIGDISGKSYWDLSDGTIVVVNANKNFNNRYEQFKFGSIAFTNASGWLNTRTTQQTANGFMVGDTVDSVVVGRERVYIIPNLPATSSNSDATTESVILSGSSLKIMSGYKNDRGAGIALMDDRIEINNIYDNQARPGIIIGWSELGIWAKRTDYSKNIGTGASSFNSAIRISGYTSLENTIVSMTAQVGITGTLSVTNSVSCKTLTVSGTKNRSVETKQYGERLLYCYETPSPLFGDVGSGMTDEDGICIVEIDDIFSRCCRTDMKYQVFLQKCGQGDLWVSDKNASYFIVEGTPNLAFDWEMKCRQKGFETERLEDRNVRDESDEMGVLDTGVFAGYEGTLVNDEDNPYAEELGYVESMERMYHDEINMEE